MGLDMYFFAHKNSSILTDDLNDERAKNFYPAVLDDIRKKIQARNFLSKDESYQVGYWRKANAIHKWFVDNCGGGEDNCRELYVSKEDMEKLKDLCEQVLADHSKAPKLLPTTDGFFFGGTEYDDWYFRDLKYTVDLLNDLLSFSKEREKEKDWWDFSYQASW